MPSGPRRSFRADVLVAISGLLAFAAYVWLLMRATPVVVTAFSFASDNKPELYAAFLALLVGLPGVLWTIPRAARPPVPAVVPSVRSRRQLSGRRQSFLRTDLLGLALLLLAQVPLPAPWGPWGKAATIANITRSPEIVQLSAQFATYSLGVFVVGVAAAVIVKVYGHAAAYRVIGIILAVGAPVVAWFLALRTF